MVSSLVIDIGYIAGILDSCLRFPEKPAKETRASFALYVFLGLLHPLCSLFLRLKLDLYMERLAVGFYNSLCIGAGVYDGPRCLSKAVVHKRA